MKKKTFLLLEVLIALFLVTLCIVPLTGYPIYMFKREQAKLERLEKEQLADWIFSELKERFLKNEIPWEKIPIKNQVIGPFSLPDIKIKCPAKTLHCSYKLRGKGEKKGKNGEEFRLIYLNLYIGDTKYQYRLPIQRIASK